MFKSKLSLCFGTAALTLGIFVFAACHKNDKTTTTTEDSGYAADHNLAEKTYTDAQTISDQGAAVGTGGSINYRTTLTSSGPCATVTHSGDSIIVDFGSTDCLCLDGRLRRGKIITTYTGGAYSDSGSVHTTTFSGYYVDDNAVTGTKTVQNMGHNSLGYPYFNVTVNGTITKATGGTVTANWSRVRTWLTGYATPTTWSDDSYSISGSGTLTRTTAAGVTTTVNVSISTATPLIVAWGCRYIEAGTITYTLSSGAVRSIDFGATPVCNATATLTWAGGSIVITLP